MQFMFQGLRFCIFNILLGHQSFWSKFDGRVLRGQEKIFEDPAGALWAEERKRWLVRSSGGGTRLGRVLAVRAGRRI